MVDKVIKRFGLKIKKYTFLNFGILVDTDEGNFILKKINLTESRILFLHGVKEYLARRGFPYTDRYFLSKGKPYVKYKDDIYVMIKLINGKKCSYFNDIEIKKASRTLGRFHNASKGYTEGKEFQENSNLGKWPKIFLDRCDDFIYIKNLINMKTNKTYIDKLFLENVERIYNMSMECAKQLQKNKYFEVVENEGKYNFLCHNNYNFNNVIIDNNHICNIINFDYCKFELRCFDLASFIMSNIIRFNWDFDRALKILEWYNDVRLISKDELKIMACIFQFPYEFWRLANCYYYEKYISCDLYYYINFKRAVKNIDLQNKFLEKYYKEFI
ncbi:spore coat protein, CotS family [Caminicella sporogenes DSM 14501]|uniref:Spore coat protein, CotS family n=1 Tax=Caminicella sporogenes DSM 14501 TaxID=1121266 RepID=A0A1M6T449_9FIRM|nr:CotS family spore coat protein [Caminicella sporogenes]RKD25489.1 hypothetical protein BET04_11185 [Caminicella sporogenes]SHK51669.1 spore coat protein, CotS family [Caminicella sporogenes DSM 14501]